MQLNHPPFSPGLDPSYYYLFPNQKYHLRGTRFQDDDELNAATEAWFGTKQTTFILKA